MIACVGAASALVLKTENPRCHAPACCHPCRGEAKYRQIPVVSLRSTTGYWLQSLRLTPHTAQDLRVEARFGSRVLGPLCG